VIESWSVHVLLVPLKRNAHASRFIRKQFGIPCKEKPLTEAARLALVDIHQYVLKSTTRAGAVRDVRDMRERRDSKFRASDLRVSYLSSGGSELPLGLAVRYSYRDAIGEAMITPDVLTEYLRRMLPDAAVTVSDRTGTMNHLKVVVISAAFAGKNLLDRHRLVYQALDGPMKDGRIHALEITAKTTDET
jgi:stress-induced morphogen